jgi:hypothetical protein
MNKNKNNKNANVKCIAFDSCYVLTKGEKGVLLLAIFGRLLTVDDVSGS